MATLEEKLSQLLKSLFKLKEQQDFFVPGIKGASLKTPSAPKTIRVGTENASSLPGLPTLPGQKITKVPKPKELPAHGMAPKSQKDPTKVAEQLQANKPQKAPVEVLKFEKNGQWLLSKAQRAARSLGSLGIGDSPISLRTSEIGNSNDATPVIPHQQRTARYRQMITTPVSADSEGWKQTHSPEQNKLINGLTLHDATPIGVGVNAAMFAKSPLHNDEVVVKNSTTHSDRGLRGHLRNNFNSARREVLFHDLAHQFFGLGKHVPLTAGFTRDGEDWSAQKKVTSASHPKLVETDDGDTIPKLVNPNHERILREMAGNGELDKISMMDHIMGHHNRHRKNMMMDDSGDNLHLIDNGAAFDYGNLDAHPVPQYRSYVQGLKLHNGRDGITRFHPAAIKWLNSLDPEQAKEIFKAHGHQPNSPAVRGFLGRLNHLRNNFIRRGIFPNGLLAEGRKKTHQTPEEYR